MRRGARRGVHSIAWGVWVSFNPYPLTLYHSPAPCNSSNSYPLTLYHSPAPYLQVYDTEVRLRGRGGRSGGEGVARVLMCVHVCDGMRACMCAL